MTQQKFSLRGMGISVIHLREINPLGWAGGAPLLGQVRRIVIEHRRKVEHDKHKPAKSDLLP